MHHLLAFEQLSMTNSTASFLSVALMQSDMTIKVRYLVILTVWSTEMKIIYQRRLKLNKEIIKWC